MKFYIADYFKQHLNKGGMDHGGISLYRIAVIWSVISQSVILDITPVSRYAFTAFLRPAEPAAHFFEKNTPLRGIGGAAITGSFVMH